jgi:hypothetical protein
MYVQETDQANEYRNVAMVETIKTVKLLNKIAILYFLLPYSHDVREMKHKRLMSLSAL